MGHFYRSEIHGCHLCLLSFPASMFLLTVGGNIMWHEPPPIETVTDASSISRTNEQVIHGSLNEELSCNFSLTSDLRIRIVSMKFRDQPLVTFAPNVLLRVEPVFAKHFNAVWVPNKLKLILFNVTDAEEGEYCCEVVTIGRSPRTWIRKIQLLVVDRIQTTLSTFTASEDQRQTTVSTFTAAEDQRQIITFFTAKRHSTGYSITASEGNVPWGIIGAVVGVAIANTIAVMVCSLKRRKRVEKIHLDDQQGNEEVDIVQDGYALLRPLSADGINGNQSKRDIQEKKEDPSV